MFHGGDLKSGYSRPLHIHAQHSANNLQRGSSNLIRFQLLREKKNRYHYYSIRAYRIDCVFFSFKLKYSHTEKIL